MKFQNTEQRGNIYDWSHIYSIVKAREHPASVSPTLKPQATYYKTHQQKDNVITSSSNPLTWNGNTKPMTQYVRSSGVNGEAGVLCNAVPWLTPNPGYGSRTSAQCTFKPPVNRYVVPLIKIRKSEKCDTQPHIFLVNCQSLNAKKSDELRIIAEKLM